MILRAGGVMHSSEDGKPRENEEGTWSVKKGEVHISVDGDNFVFEIKGNGNLQVVALLNNGVREDAPEIIKKGFNDNWCYQQPDYLSNDNFNTENKGFKYSLLGWEFN